MITRCPECTTLFKVVADQLKISDGWVRCGQCGKVFDGGANLQEDPTAELFDPHVIHSTAVAADHSGQWQTSSSSDAAPQGSLEHPSPNAGSADSESVAIRVESDGADFTQDSNGSGAAQASTVATQDEQDLIPVEVSFVRTVRSPSIWANPTLRWLLGFCAMLLLLGLFLQVAVFERDRIAATLPEARPWLQNLCQSMACAVEPLKDIDAITVDSSAFNRIRGDVYRLQVTLKNTARTELALPSVELTLTDTRDSAVLRRILLPADFQTSARSIAASAEWSGSVTVSVAGATGPSRVAGYRVLAFYP